MSADGRVWGWAAVAVVLAVAAGLRIDARASFAPARLDAPALGGDLVAGDGAAPSDGAACPTWTLVAGQGDLRGAEAVLVTDGLLRLDPCKEGASAVALRGTPVAGVGAWAVVTDARGVVFAGHLDGDGPVLPVTGPVLVSFSNDVARGGEDRNLYAIAR